MPHRPSVHRRDVLRALGAGAASLPLAGCGVGWPLSRREPEPLPIDPAAPVGPTPVDSTNVDALPRAELAPIKARPTPPSRVLAPRLREGGTIGLVAPAGVLRSRSQVQDAVADMRGLGFETKTGRHVLARFGFLAGTDEQRAEDFMRMVEDPDVDAILCMRGGWGCARILPLLDYDTIASNPKPIIGYSDVTSLLLAVYARTGLVTFHGPVGISTWQGATASSFMDVLVHGEPLRIAGESRTTRLVGETVTGGTAEGPLAGGNLSVLSAMAGTGFLPDLSGHVVFFEEVGEDSYRLDRMLTQLVQAGTLTDASALVFGQCSNCSDGGSSWSAADVIRQHLGRSGAPAWLGAPIGHVSPVYTLPVGLPVRTDADAHTLEAIGPAVA